DVVLSRYLDQGAVSGVERPSGDRVDADHTTHEISTDQRETKCVLLQAGIWRSSKRRRGGNGVGGSASMSRGVTAGCSARRRADGAQAAGFLTTLRVPLHHWLARAASQSA